MNRFRKWVLDTRAATATEYVLIASGIALAIVGAAFAFGDTLAEFFVRIRAGLDF